MNALRVIRDDGPSWSDADLLADAWLAGLSEEARQCRELGHQMAYVHQGWVLEYSTYYRMVLWIRNLRCRRGCGFRRLDYFDPDRPQDKIGGRADYSDAPGYLRPAGAGRMYRSDVTRAKILRLSAAMAKDAR